MRCGTNCPHSPRISLPSSYFEMFTLSASSSALDDDRKISKCSKSSFFSVQEMSTPHMSFRSSFTEMLAASLRYIDTAALNLQKLDKIKLDRFQKQTWRFLAYCICNERPASILFFHRKGIAHPKLPCNIWTTRTFACTNTVALSGSFRPFHNKLRMRTLTVPMYGFSNTCMSILGSNVEGISMLLRN